MSPFALLVATASVGFLVLYLALVGEPYGELERKLDLPLPQLGTVTAQPPTAQKLEIRIQGRRTAHGEERVILIGERAMKKWEQVVDELRSLSAQSGAASYHAFVVPSEEALHGWVATTLDHLAEHGFRNVRLCPAEKATPPDRSNP